MRRQGSRRRVSAPEAGGGSGGSGAPAAERGRQRAQGIIAHSMGTRWGLRGVQQQSGSARAFARVFVEPGQGVVGVCVGLRLTYARVCA